jgi:hypothetical protein
MSRNGSGGYSLLSNSWNPAVNGVTATAADWQALINDVAAAIQQSISADGQTPITGNLQMGGNKLTNLAAGSGTGQSLRYEQLFSQGTLTDIASAATLDIGAPLTNFLRVTGTTGVTSFGTNYNGPRFLIFAGVVLLTHSATLVLPTGANITTAAGDSLIAIPISGGWQVVAYQRANGTALVSNSTDYLNTTRIDVASATTVDLTASAPNTRNINITGTTTITGFTVAIGQVYFVRFNAALTLTNNAAIVTQRGANITTAAGDTCILRSTAANTVEVLSYSYAAVIPDAFVTPAKLSQPFVLGTAVPTTSGSSVSFSSIPSYVSEIELKMFSVSLTGGSDHFLVRVGTGGSLATSGYSSAGVYITSGSSSHTSTAGCIFPSGAAANPALLWTGTVSISRVSSTEWAISGSLSSVAGAVLIGTSSITLGGQLDIVGLANNGTSTFDNGKVNISYF